MRALLLLPLLVAAGCPSEDSDPADTDLESDADTDADTDADSDTDTDADTDADADTDSDTDTEPVYDPEFVTAAAVVTGRCANCHGANGPGGFEIPAGAASTLAQVQAALDGQTDGDGVLMVDPGSSATSSLWINANGHSGATPQQRTDIQIWIDNGAVFVL